MKYVDKVMAPGGETDDIAVVGQCDILVQGLTSGSVKLQYLPPATEELPAPEFSDFPDGEFTEDVYKTIFMSDGRVRFKLVGIGNNDGVYAKIARFHNS